MQGSYKTEGIVLKRINFGEADRLLTLYSKHYGKIRVLAKGVRRVTSRKGGNLEIFNHVSLFLIHGRNLDLLTEAQVINPYKSWRKELKKIGLAYYLCELVDKLTPEGQENQVVFALLRDSLGLIDEKKPLALIRDFEEELLDELGFGVPLALKRRPGSLKAYIESIIEAKIKSPKILHDLA
jgi:DNA repair protein RecO (recombination protein O)